VRAQPAQDVPLHPEIVGGDLQPPLGAAGRRHAELVGIFLRPVERLRSVTTRTRSEPSIGGIARARSTSVSGSSLRRPDHAAQHAARSQMPRQRAGIDVGNGDDLVVDEIVAQRAIRAPVAGDGDSSRMMNPATCGAARLDVLPPTRRSSRSRDTSSSRSAGDTTDR
jgi:hypothetical protein